MVRSPSRYADTVLLRRALLRTSTALDREPRGGWFVALWRGSTGTPRRYPPTVAEVPPPDGSNAIHSLVCSI
jgi:hypothetical protein